MAARVRLLAIATVARFHGADLPRGDLAVPDDAVASPAALVEWVGRSGLWAEATRLRWRQLVTMDLVDNT